MQSAALAEQLSIRFPSAQIEIIDYSSAKMDRYYKMITIYRGMESAIHILKRIEMYRAFQKGLRQLPLSKERLISDNAKTFEKWLGDRYDILITGSDAVWNYNKRGLPNPYFLSGNIEVKRFSYAASCNGLNISTYKDITEEQREYLKNSFDKFEFIGVRDEQTERLVHEVCPNIPVYHNCDPSILYEDLSGQDRTKLLKKLQKKYGFDPNKPTIAFMMSNLNGGFRAEISKRIKEKYGNKYQTVSLYSYNTYADIPYVSDLTPQEWSIIFGLFDLTISKYFHGVMFSLLNHTPVIAVGAETSIEGLPNKISDALGRMNLLDFYFQADQVNIINWDELMQKIDNCLKDKPLDRIVAGIEKERESAESFFDSIGKAIGRKPFFSELDNIEKKSDVELKKYTTFRMGGKAKTMYIPKTESELIHIVNEIGANFLIGGGSNLVISERDFDNVINLRKFNTDIQEQGNGIFVVGASVRLQKLITTINEKGYGGIEYLFSVPGLVGGAIVMNAGRGKLYSASISDYILEVKVWHKGKVKWMQKNECNFAYRSSVFSNGEYVILAVKYQFPVTDAGEAEKLRKERIALCKEKQDNSAPNFGTVFCESNKVIMQMFKYLPIGRGSGISYSRKTSNWLLNNGGSFDEVVKMIHRVKRMHALLKQKCRIEVVIWK